MKVRPALEISLHVLRPVSEWTSNTLDDKGVELIEAILESDELLDMIEQLIANDEPLFGSPVTAAVETELIAKGLPALQIAKYLPLVIEIVRGLKEAFDKRPYLDG